MFIGACLLPLLINKMGVMPLRGTWKVWRKEPKEIHKKKFIVLNLGNKKTQAPLHSETDNLQSSFEKKDPGALVNKMNNMAFMVKKPNSIQVK